MSEQRVPNKSNTYVTFVPILANVASTEIYNSGKIVIGTCNK